MYTYNLDILGPFYVTAPVHIVIILETKIVVIKKCFIVYPIILQIAQLTTRNPVISYDAP